jgi:hypothetical protein
MAKKKQKARRLVSVQVDRIGLVDQPAVGEATFVIAKRDDTAESEAGDVEVEKANAKTAKAFVSCIQGLRKVAGDMDGAELRTLAELMYFCSYHHKDHDGVVKELRKGLEVEDHPELDGCDLVKCDFGDGLEVELVTKAGRVLNKANADRLMQAASLLKEVCKSAGLEKADDDGDDDSSKGYGKDKKKGDKEKSESGVKKGDEDPPVSMVDAAGEALAKEKEEAVRKQAAEDSAVLKALQEVTTELKETRDVVDSGINQVYRDLAKHRGAVSDDELPAESSEEAA